MTRRRLLPLLAASLPATTSATTPADTDINALLEPIRAARNVPALAGGIVTTSGLTAAGVTGVRKRNDPTPATISDLWHLGSMTKAMTATLIGTWVQSGKLNWDDPITKFLAPLLKDATPEFSAITVRHLLSHRSGLPANRKNWAALPLASQRPDIVRLESKRPTLTPPGSTFLYSNLGYMFAGVITESLGNALWENLITSRLFKPLGITAGFGGTGTPGTIDQPWPHLEDGTPTGTNGPAIDNPASLGPAGTCHATLDQYARFLADQLRGAAGKDSLLPPALYKDIQFPRDGESYAFGWGLHQRSWADGNALAHTGSNTMNSFAAWVAPAKGFAVIAASNQGGKPGASACDDACAALLRKHLG